jgi:RNA polymerase sigma-70 factor (ECF subfamily)
MSVPGEVDQILVEYEGRIRVFFRRRCPNPDDVDDLVQEALCAILGSYGRFMHRSSLSTWIYAICRNVFSNHEYRRRREDRMSRALRHNHDETPMRDTSEIRLVLAGLSPSQTMMYALYYVDGRSVRWIAARLGKPEGTVKYLLYRLRRHISAMLG